jgi:twitching motility protein PilT
MSKIGLPALLKTMVDQDASDLHLTVGVPPELRIHGKIVKIKADVLTASDTKEICYSILSEYQKEEFEKNLEIDFSFGIKDLARFRGNFFIQRGMVAGVFRRIPLHVPDFDQLKLPAILKKIVRKPNGLILVTGPTGSGKTTSLAAILDFLNREESGHLITIEDPIEFVHAHKSCVVNQREVGSDIRNFKDALKRILRQDPDFIMVGELRDSETIEAALTLAETGHLVFGTLHTNGAAQSVNRLINSFSPHQQAQVRTVLSFTLMAVLSQMLIPKTNQPGRVMVYELMIANQPIRSLIREDKIHQIYSAMQSGQDDTGMQTMNQSLMNFVKHGSLSKADALEYSPFPDELGRLMSSIPDSKLRA